MRPRSRKSDTPAPDEGTTPPDAEQSAPADGQASALLRQTAMARSSRRHMMMRAGGVAAATVAGLTLLDTRRAEAVNGGNFILGGANNANATTSLSPTTAGTKALPLFKVDGTALSSTSTTVEIDSSQGAAGLVVTASNLGSTRTGLAIEANAAGAALGIVGNSQGNTGVTGNSGTGIGVYGHSTSGDGVRGVGKRGGDFTGAKAGVRLRPASGSHPSKGLAGDLFVDSNHHLWFCRGGSTWVKLA